MAILRPKQARIRTSSEVIFLLFGEVSRKYGLQVINVMYRLSAIGYLPAIFEYQNSVTVHQGGFGGQIITTRSFLPGNEAHVELASTHLGNPISHIKHVEFYSNTPPIPIREYTYVVSGDWLIDSRGTPRENWN
jgi:hypothetical protein